MDKVNIDGLCGICLMESHSYLCIFEERAPDGSYIYEVMNEVCQLKISAGEESGNLICLECHTKLLNFKSFKRDAQKARELFQQMKDDLGKVIIKEEFVEEYPVVIPAEEPCNEPVTEITMQIDEPNVVCKQEEYFIENEENTGEETVEWEYEDEPFERIRVKHENELQECNARTESELSVTNARKTDREPRREGGGERREESKAGTSGKRQEANKKKRRRVDSQETKDLRRMRSTIRWTELLATETPEENRLRRERNRELMRKRAARKFEEMKRLCKMRKSLRSSNCS